MEYQCLYNYSFMIYVKGRISLELRTGILLKTIFVWCVAGEDDSWVIYDGGWETE